MVPRARIGDKEAMPLHLVNLFQLCFVRDVLDLRPWEGLVSSSQSTDHRSSGADQCARPRRERAEVDLVILVGLLHAGRLQVLQDHLGETPFVAVARFAFPDVAVDQIVVLINPSTRCGDRLSTVNGPVTQNYFLS